MIDGIAGRPFSAETLPPPIPLENSNREKIIKASRERYGIKREVVDDKISRWSGFGPEEEDLKGTSKKNNSATPRNQQNILTPQKFSAPRLGNPVLAAPQGVPAPQGGDTKLYDAVCSNCGKPTKVIFPPEKGRAVYCKSCLKKMKAGQEMKGQESRNRESRTQEPKNTGIFGPAATGRESFSQSENSRTRSFREAEPPDLEEVKIENVSFHNPKNSALNRAEGRPEKPRRKEINLSELKKALEKSLGKKKEDEDINEGPGALSGSYPEKLAKPQPTSASKGSGAAKDELQSRIEEEKEMDKFTEGESPESGDKKKVIKPGETVKF